jgi:hypothetical protein
MTALLDDRFVPITTSVGLIKAALDETKHAFLSWQTGILSKYNQSLTERSLHCSLSEAMSGLLPLSSPIPTRYLLLSINRTWTAFFDNGHRGTDPVAVIAVLSRDLHTLGFRLTSQRNTIKSEDKSAIGSYGATIFEAFENSLESRRSVARVNDGGKWVFEESGTPFPFENETDYLKSRESKRFGPDLLEQYVREFGVEPFSERSYVDQDGHVCGALVEKTGDLPATLKYVEIDTARRSAYTQ